MEEKNPPITDFGNWRFPKELRDKSFENIPELEKALDALLQPILNDDSIVNLQNI